MLHERRLLLRPSLARVFAAALTLALAPHAARAATGADLDGDGVSDVADVFPCDWRRSAATFIPSENALGTLLFEDNWPSQGDLDFNDAVLAYNYAVFLDPRGRASGVRVTLVPRALGAKIDSGLALQLPVPRAALASARLTVGGGASSALTPVAGEALVTVVIAERLRALFGSEGNEFINTQGAPSGDAAPVIVELDFAEPVELGVAADVFDLFFFRSDAPGHEVHRPRFSGTSRMDTTLFGTGDDGSSGARRFVDRDGLPFVLEVPAQVSWPTERTRIERLWPTIVGFAASGGATDSAFYLGVGDAQAGFGASLTLAPGAPPYDRCLLPTCSDGVRNGLETDLDCGAGCGGCDSGRACLSHTDCASSACSGSLCVPEASRPCALPNGTGLEYPSSGATWGGCSATACDLGFHVDGTSCALDERGCTEAHGTGRQTWTGSAWGACVLSGCSLNYHLDAGSCVADLRACPFEHGQGAQTWRSGVWGACEVTACDDDYHIEVGVCGPDVRACAVVNGAGSQTWNNGWGACVPTSCAAGFHVEAGACSADVRACAITNGTGSQSWSGGRWGACTLSGCNANFTPQGNACVLFTSCVALKEANPSAVTGVYSLDPGSNGQTTQVYCDMDTDGGGWTMVYKYSAGTAIPASVTGLGDEFVGGPLNEGDTALLDLQRAPRRYVSSLISTTWGSFSQARVAVVAAGAPVQWMLYDLGGSTPSAWYQRSRLLDSSWQDLVYEPQNIWSFRGDESIRRTMLIERNYGGCPNDVGWLVIVQGATCAWEQSRPNTILYAPGVTATNWTTGTVGQADAVVVMVRERRPSNAGACASGTRLQGGACLSNTTGCAIANGRGEQTYSNGSWGACGVVACNSGYRASSNACVQLTYAWTAGAWSTCSGGTASPSYGAWGACAGGSGTWAYGAWGACSASSVCSGAGSQNRSATCGFTGNSGAQSRSAACAWDASSGAQTRSVGCVNNFGEVVDASLCTAAQPAATQGCTPAGSPSSCGSFVTSQACTPSDPAVCGAVGATAMSCSSPAGSRACTVTNGVGTQSCDAGSTAWTSCAMTSCNGGFHAELGICVSDTRSCAVSNGSGTQTWTGSAYGTCSASSCNAGYHVETGVCTLDTRSCTLANGSGTQSWTGSAYGTCVPVVCDAGFHIEAGACNANTRSCAFTNGTGSQTWSSGAWGACTLVSCNAGYNAVGGACRIYGTCLGLKEADSSLSSGVYSIDPANSGSPVSVYCDMATDGGGWTMVYKHSAGTTIPAANTTFGGEFSAGAMNETDSTLLNLSRSSRRYVSSIQSRYWASFAQARVAVAAGGSVAQWMLYDLAGSTADNWFARSRLLDSSWQDLIYQTQNHWSFRGDETNRRHIFVNGSYNGCPQDFGWLVVAQGSTCSWETTRPNSILYSTSPYIQNWTTGTSVGQADAVLVMLRERRPTNAAVCASGTRLESGACLSNTRGCAITNGQGTQTWSGGAWGACSVALCSGGYHAEAGACASDTRSCAITNGTGSQTWTGSAYGACTLVSCNSAYHLESGVCTSDTRSCAITNGTGTQTWTGSAYGSCSPASCNGGFHVESGACVTDTRSCAVTNGTGSQTWTGSAYGTCAPTSCNSGFHVESGACAADTRSCAISNGTGSQTWTGSAYGSCTLVSCNSGYTASNNACRIYSSCLGLKEANAALPDGIYTIDPANNGGLLQVWCDMTTDGGGWTMIYKHSAGTTIPAATTGFGTEFSAGAMNETNSALLGRQRSTSRYISSLITRYWSSFAQARVEVVVGGNVAQWMYYDISGSTADNWYTRARLRDSSWVDILRLSQNYWSFRGDEGIRRHMFINQNYGGCPADVGWFVVSQSGTSCSWETSRPNSILFANSFSAQNWTTGAIGSADAVVITVRERRPTNASAGPTSCVALRNAGNPSGFYSIDVLGTGGLQRVYCDMTTDGGGWALAYKHSSGQNRVMADDVTTAAVNPTDETLMDRGLETADFAGRLWSTLYFSRFTEARLEVVTGGTVRQYVVFNLANQTQTGFFQRSTVTRTSWTDLTTAASNIFSMTGEPTCARRTFMNNLYNGCPGDVGWLVSLGGTGCNCGWETSNSNQVMYANATTRQNWTSGTVARADAIVVWLR